MRHGHKGKAPSGPTEREIVNAIDRLVAQAASIGMPIEDLAYLASTVLYDCTKHVPDGARLNLVNVITEFAEDVRRRRSGEAPMGHVEQGRSGLQVVEGGLSEDDDRGGASGGR